MPPLPTVKIGTEILLGVSSQAASFSGETEDASQAS
jgi:hypothetical protein